MTRTYSGGRPAHGADRPKQMTRLIAVAVTILVIAAFSAACATRGPLPASDLNEIVEQGTVRVCSTGDYRPYTYRDGEGQWSGIDIEMAHDLAGRLGVELELFQTTWSDLMADLGTNCELAMGGITITLDRAKQALYSNPVLRDGKAAIVRCTDESKYTNLADIDRPDVRLVVNPGGTNAEFVKTHIHHATVVTYPDNNSIFDQILNNDADAMITDASEIRWQTTKNPRLCGVAVDQPFTFTQKAYLLPQSAEVLRQWVNEWLNIVQNDGTYAEISRRWTGQVMKP